ncbi:MAG: ADP-ribosylglycohydrolase family protein [Muribaculaceae bacterium]|nr:ADP-ribosylglycohydrolase family protein [Muribaculaceae bacterium]
MNFSDRIKGAIFGMALGDALGLGTEFMTADEVKFHYPDGLRHFSEIIRDGHRCMWKRGEWTNDTNVNLIFIQSILECEGLDIRHFASKLKEWFSLDGIDMPDFYNELIHYEGWEDHPLETTHHVWMENNLSQARNEALPRAIISGILGNPRLLGNTLDCISLTHDDSRCVSTGVLVALMADSLLRTGEPASYDTLRASAHTLDGRTIHALDVAYSGKFEDIAIDDPDNIWQTRKCMAAALWTVWHCNSAEETLSKIIDAGGDADTNGAVAMGLAGLKYGYKALPEEVKQLRKFNELEEIADKFIEFMEKYEAAKQ